MAHIEVTAWKKAWSRSLNWMFRWNYKTAPKRETENMVEMRGRKGEQVCELKKLSLQYLIKRHLFLLAHRVSLFPFTPAFPCLLLSLSLFFSHMTHAFFIFSLPVWIFEVISKWLFFDTWGNTCVAFAAAFNKQWGLERVNMVGYIRFFF